MLITAIRDYLFNRGQANLQDLARHFHIQESAMEQMLAFWLKKGVIQQLNINDNDCSRSGGTVAARRRPTRSLRPTVTLEPGY